MGAPRLPCLVELGSQEQARGAAAWWPHVHGEVVGGELHLHVEHIILFEILATTFSASTLLEGWAAATSMLLAPRHARRGDGGILAIPI